MAKFLQLSSFVMMLIYLGSGCAIVGKEPPVAMKSEKYRVLKLDQISKGWQKIDDSTTDGQNYIENSSNEYNRENEIPDVAYQSLKTSSIISLNSACRERIRHEDYSLRFFTDSLLLGITDLKSRSEKQTQVSGLSALTTTVTGKLNSEDIILQAVVLKQDDCIYDMTYISRPKNFDQEVALFEKFTQSFRINQR